MKKATTTPINGTYLILLIAYGFLTVFTPTFKAYDSNGPKFLALAILNLVTFLFIFWQKGKNGGREGYHIFFNNVVGIAYTGLILISILSFMKSVNILESLLHFSKIFTTFSAAFLVSILFTADNRSIRYLCIAMTFLLLYDSLSVFTGIKEYINGKLISIVEIKSVYSNKNILASSIFIKVPFALWLLIFDKGKMRILGAVGVFFSFTATFFLSTRAFYIGIFILAICLLTYFIFRYLKTQDKDHIRLTGLIITLLLSSGLLFTLTQKYLYPQSGDLYNTSIGNRLLTIAEPGGGGRIEGWKRSWHLFKEDPILGVGLGNWKIAVLKEENLKSQDFNYEYKAHNDFVETATETGIFGALFFIAIFLLIGFAFIGLNSHVKSDDVIARAFVPTFGILCYSVDAFFNFPQDRPEIQAIFALFVGSAIAVTASFSSFKSPILPIVNSLKGKGNQIFSSGVFIHGFLIIVSIWFLILNFDSLRLQRIVKQDIQNAKLIQPASMIINGFPFMPNLSAEGEPISVIKARYLMNEKRNSEAIELLKKDKSSPFDTRVKYFIAKAFFNQNNLDSSYLYSQKVYLMQPLFFGNISLLCDLLQTKGQSKEAADILEKYLNQKRDNLDAWVFSSSFFDRYGDLQKAEITLSKAFQYFPGDSTLLKNSAAIAFKAKKFQDAVNYYSELINKTSFNPEARSYRALCFYYLMDYRKSIEDLDYLISKGLKQPNFYNQRGVNYYLLGDKNRACEDFKVSSEMGDKVGLENYSKFCFQ